MLEPQEPLGDVEFFPRSPASDSARCHCFRNEAVVDWYLTVFAVANASLTTTSMTTRSEADFCIQKSFVTQVVLALTLMHRCSRHSVAFCSHYSSCSCCSSFCCGDDGDASLVGSCDVMTSAGRRRANAPMDLYSALRIKSEFRTSIQRLQSINSPLSGRLTLSPSFCS